MCRSGMEIVGVIERTGTCEKDRGTSGVEEGICEGEGGDVQGLKMWVGVAVNLWMKFREFCEFVTRVKKNHTYIE
jgi:hypothetical protein